MKKGRQDRIAETLTTSPHFSRLKDLYPDEGNHYNQLINNKLS